MSENRGDDAQVEQVVKLGLLQKFFYLVLIPLLFTLLLTIILGSSLGIFDFSPQLNRTQNWFHNLPLIGAWIPEPELPPPSGEAASEALRKEIAAQWELIDKEKGILADRAEALDTREKLLAEMTLLYNQAQAQKDSRDSLMKHLVTTVETMQPAAAAAMFDTMDEETAAEILVNMAPDKSAKVLNLMDSEIAARLMQRIRR